MRSERDQRDKPRRELLRRPLPSQNTRKKKKNQRNHLSKRKLRLSRLLLTRKLPRLRRKIQLNSNQPRPTPLLRTPLSLRRTMRNTKTRKMPSSQTFHQSSPVPLVPSLQLQLLRKRSPLSKLTLEATSTLTPRTATAVRVTQTEKQILTAIEKVGIRNHNVKP